MTPVDEVKHLTVSDPLRPHRRTDVSVVAHVTCDGLRLCPSRWMLEQALVLQRRAEVDLKESRSLIGPPVCSPGGTDVGRHHCCLAGLESHPGRRRRAESLGGSQVLRNGRWLSRRTEDGTGDQRPFTRPGTGSSRQIRYTGEVERLCRTANSFETAISTHRWQDRFDPHP